MNSAKHVEEPAGNAVSVGRIVPLNMTSGTGRLSYDSLIQDMTTTNDYNDPEDCVRCRLWA